MTNDDVHSKAEQLQFDVVVSEAPPGQESNRRRGVTCAGCSATIETEYYHVNGQTTCERCREAVAEKLAVPRGLKTFASAAALGIGAAIAGAIVYYAVIAITDFEIGIVAILIGYMVGWAVRKGTAGRGGRRFQILAAILTYWAVGLAYTPLAFKGASESDTADTSAVVADSARDSSYASPAGSSSVQATALDGVPGSSAAAAAVDDDAPDPARNDDRARNGEEKDSGSSSILLGLGALLLFVFALPVIVVAGSLPSGLISAFIIFIGIHQAWRMTGAPALKVSGPYRVGAGASASGS